MRVSSRGAPPWASAAGTARRYRPRSRKAELAGLCARILAREGDFKRGTDAIVWQCDAEAAQRRSDIGRLEFGLFALTLLAHEIEGISRSGHPLSICFIDLDGIKRVDDRYGHEEGDRFIAGFAGLIRGSIRAGDMGFRYGGDEFVLALSCDRAGAEAQMGRLAELAAAGDPSTGRPWRFSQGIASFEPGFAGYSEALIAPADQRMYAMKEAHRREGQSPLRRDPD